MTASKTRGGQVASPEPTWREEWVAFDSIVKHGPLQVRRRLDNSAVRRYSDMTKAGSEPPPIKLGRCKGQYFLVDGWHRMEADALVQMRGHDGHQVMALVADLNEDQVRWEAANANMGHGVPLKSSEYRNVLGAFIKAGKHRGPGGTVMSYRDLGAVVGKGHTTVRNWVIKDFPKLASQIGGKEGGNVNAEQPPLDEYTLADELRDQAILAMRSIATSLPGLTPEDRWLLVKELDVARLAAIECGIKEPAPEPF